MAEVTVFTADRMLAIESGTVVDGTVDGSGHLILTTHGGTPIDAGNVVGPPGSDAPAGSSVAYQTTPPVTPAVGDVWVDSDDIIPLTSGTGSTSSVPVGGIIAFGGTIAPLGWQICDGAASSTSDLIAVVGANVPDLRGKFILGVSATHAAGSTGGAETVTLSTTQIPSHQHTMANHTHSGTSSTVSSDHAHNFSTGGRSAAHTHGTAVLIGKLASLANSTGSSPGQLIGGVADTRTSQTPPGWSPGTESADHSHSGTTGGITANHTHTMTTGGPSNNTSDASGGGGSHENMPPYWALIYIIRSAA